MEPLVEENEKLKEAMNLIEKNIQRAQHERDLAESNAWDLEYKKGILSEQLATMSEQLCGKSEQLATVFEQLTSTSEQLERKSKQLRNVFEQKIGMAYPQMCFVLLKVILLLTIVVLVDQGVELGQLCQTVKQLQEEKAK